jgi:hypothetical protein
MPIAVCLVFITTWDFEGRQLRKGPGLKPMNVAAVVAPLAPLRVDSKSIPEGEITGWRENLVHTRIILTCVITCCFEFQCKFTTFIEIRLMLLRYRNGNARLLTVTAEHMRNFVEKWNVVLKSNARSETGHISCDRHV